MSRKEKSQKELLAEIRTLKKKLLEKEKDERCKIAFEEASDAIVIIDRKGAIKAVNKKSTRVFGFKKSELLSKNLKDLFDPEDVSKNPVKFTSLKEGGNLLVERVFLNAKGKQIPTEINFKKIHSDEILGIIRDISERKKYRQELMINQVQTRIFSERTPSVVWTTDIKLNLNSYSVKGKTVKKLVGQKIKSIFPGKPLTYEPIAGHQKALKGITAKVIHYENERVFESVLEPLKDDKSRIIGVVGCSFDITDRVKEQQALKQSEQLFRTIAENSEDVVFKVVFSSKGYKYDFISPSVKKLTGYEQQEYYKDPSLSFRIILDEDKHIAGDIPSGIPNGCIPRKYENRLIHRNGSVLYVETMNNFFLDETGKASVIIGVTRNVTDRKLTENALLKSEERFRKMAEATSEGILIHDNGIISDVNSAFCKMLGYEESELIGSNAVELVAEDYQGIVKEAIVSGRSDSYQVVGKRKDNKTFYAELTPRVLNLYGNQVRMVAVRDITLRKLHEAALAESEEQYRFLFQKSPLPMIVYDKETFDIKNVNEAAIETYGYSMKEFLRMNVLDIRPESEKAKFTSLYSVNPSTAGFVCKGQWTHRKKNGDLFEVEVTRGTIQTTGTQYNIAIIKDISELQEQERLLKESESRFRMLAENAVDVVYRFQVHPVKKYEYVSPSVYLLTGYTPEDFYNDPYLGFKLVHEEDRKITDDSEVILKAGKNVHRLRENTTILRWVKKDGGIIWTETRNKPIFDDEGRVTYIEGISRNISERIKLEHELIESRETYKLLLESIPAGVLIIDNDRIVYANPSAFHIFGSDDSQPIGNISIFDYILPAYHNKIQASNERVKRGEKFPFLEIKARRSDGAVIDLETRSVLVKYKGRDCIQVIFYDITYRKRIEQSIRESEERLKVISGASQEGIVFTNNAHQIVDCNNRFLQLFNYHDINQIIGRFIWEITGCPQAKCLEILNTFSKPVEQEIAYNGSIFFAEFRSEHIPYNGQVLTATVIHDITSRKAYETEIDKSRKTYKEIIESSPDAIVISRHGFIIYVNPEAKRLFEVEKDEILGKDILSLVPEKLHDFVRERRLAAERGEDLNFVEIELLSLKGNTRFLETKSIKVQYQGEPAIMVVMHDLSERKQLEKEKLRARIAEETNTRLQEEIERHQRTQKKLELNQQYTRSIIESSLDMILAADINGNITEFNKAAQQTFGYSFEEMVGKPFDCLYASQEEKERVISEITKTGHFKGEVLNRKKSGEVFVAYLAASAHRNESGEQIGNMGVSRDITKLKMAEEALKLSEEKYRAIYNHVFVGIAMVSLDGRFMQVNRQLCNMFGYTEEELTTMRFMDITHPDDLGISDKLREDLISGDEKNFSLEKRYINKKGELVFAMLTSTVVRNEKGEPDYFLSVFQDITSQRKVEEQVRIQAAKLNAIFESSSHLIWTIDQENRLTSSNRNFQELIRETYGSEPSRGMLINTGKILSKQEHASVWIKRYDDAFEGTAQHFEASQDDPVTGKLIWREIYLNPIYDAANRVVEVSGIAHDITEKKLSEEKIRLSLREKEVLLKEVHHRVKNNLQVISSILNLQSSYVKDKNTLDMLRESQDRIKSMSFIHESLYAAKDFSKINFGEYIINLSKNLLHSYRVYGDQVSLDIKADTVFMNLDYAIPSGLIINELISNAFKYAFPDNRSGRVSINMTESGNTIYIIIEDNGVGLPANIDYRNTESLGLQLVCTLVDQLNGQISLDTENGTKFTVWFNKDQKII